jgi:DNA-directed RNA polymerase specialized sigma24 family protein
MDDPQLTGLIRAAQGGDVAAFAELVDLHYDTIYRFAWKWCGHRTNAEDIAQQSCIKLAGSLAQFSSISPCWVSVKGIIATKWRKPWRRTAMARPPMSTR